VVVPWESDVELPLGSAATPAAVVVDLRSRHLAPARAVERLDAVAGRPDVVGRLDVAGDTPRRWRHVHKIDSTLRGNWAVEVAALAARGHQVVVIPAHPAAGRTCVGGVVLVSGVPVADTEFGRDPSHPVIHSRPAEALDLVRVSTAAPFRSPGHDADGWRARVRVVDARTDEDVAVAVDEALREGRGGTVVAGPAAVVGAVARWISAATAVRRPSLPAGPVLVVRGSRHEASRAQVAALHGSARVTCIEPHDDVLAGADAEAVAVALAVRAHDHLHAHPDTVVVVLLGGDTAGAFLGDRAVHVQGSVGVGMALGEVDVDGRRLTVVTKPGGFGGTNALVDLLERR
jgi:uncharacterized protein YgbK (DUF1537 family)